MWWRYVVGSVAGLLLATAGVMFYRAKARPEPVLPTAPSVAQTAPGTQDEPLPGTVPEASERTREQKRFDRYDKDRDGKVTRDEYLAARKKAYAKLDTNGDGQLSFDEWATKSIGKFTTADTDRSGAMTPAEFAATAPKRKSRPRVNCPPAQATREED